MNDNQKGQEYIDTLPDSLWLKHFVLDETEEYLPPIARAMKNMLDHNTVICNSENLQENLWPHFINHTRVMQNKAFLRNTHETNIRQSPTSPKSPSLPIYTIDKKKLKVQNIGKYPRINPRLPFSFINVFIKIDQNRRRNQLLIKLLVLKNSIRLFLRSFSLEYK